MKKILTIMVNNKLLVNIIILFIIGAGFFSIQNIQKDVFPLSDIDSMVIYVSFPGASPSDVELNAVIPIERALSSITGIKDYSSYSIENNATIYAYIDTEIEDKKAVKDEIFRSITTNNVTDLSPDVEAINVIDINPKLMSVLNIAIIPKTNDFSEKDLYHKADKLEKKLLKLNGVSEVRKSGYRDREIHVNVNPNLLERYYVSLNEIVQSIQTRNIRNTGGTIQSLQKDENIVTIGQFKDPMDVKDVIIRSNFAEDKVTIGNLANVQDSFKDRNVLVRVNGKPAVSLAIVKKESADVMKTIDGVKNFLKKNSESLNRGDFNVTIIDDKSESISALLEVVISNALIGFLLVLIILVFFFDIKTSFWTAFGIPVSLLMVMTFMNAADQSINMISLGAIITVLGMLVDHGIVISEIIYEKKSSGESSISAAVSGVTAMLPPVLVTTLTTIAAFIPMLAVKGMMGKFIYIFPVIITATLIASLIEALFILPSHLAHIKHKENSEKKWFVYLQNIYRKSLNFALRFRYAVIIIFGILLTSSIFISKNTINNYVLLWDDSADAVFINFEAPEGTRLSETEKITMDLLPQISKILKPEEIIAINTNIGHHTVKRMTSKGNRENWSQYLIFLVPKSERKRTAADIIKALRKEINPKKIKNFEKISFKERVIGPAPGDAFDLKIVPDTNFEDGIKLSNEVIKYIKSIDGVKDAKDDQEKGKDEIVINFNFGRLAALGMDVSSVAQAVRTAYEGSIATSIQTKDSRLDFRVKIDDNYKRNKKFLSNLIIPNKQNTLIRLKEIATFGKAQGNAVINHYNGDRVITITAGVDGNVLTSRQLSQMVKQKFINYKNSYPDVDILFGGEAKETSDSIGDLTTAFIAALIFIYLILVLLFKSLSQPIIVLLTIPFGLTGALAAFTFHSIPLSFMGIIGIIGLAGVVVNDSVVMVDFINSLKRKQSNDSLIKEHIIEGAAQRFRPVILTTITTVAGLLPTVYGIGGDAQTLVPVVMAMAYGLLFATLITLFFIPSLYMINFDLSKLSCWKGFSFFRNILSRK